MELLIALLIIAGVGNWLWRASAPAPPGGQSDAAATARGLERHGALIALSIAAAGVLIPIVLVVLGADYLAPRNLVAAMLPLTALIAMLLASPSSGRLGLVLAATTALAFLLITVDVDLSPRLQRGNWRDVAKLLRGGATDRAITTVELGGAPLDYYCPRPAQPSPWCIGDGFGDRRDRLRPAAPVGRQAAGGGLSPSRPSRRGRADRLSLRIIGPARGSRGDAAPPRDHARAPRGARPHRSADLEAQRAAWAPARTDVVPD